jgi:hypothetical protein
LSAKNIKPQITTKTKIPTKNFAPPNATFETDGKPITVKTIPIKINIIIQLSIELIFFLSFFLFSVFCFLFFSSFLFFLSFFFCFIFFLSFFFFCLFFQLSSFFLLDIFSTFFFCQKFLKQFLKQFPKNNIREIFHQFIFVHDKIIQVFIYHLLSVNI